MSNIKQWSDHATIEEGWKEFRANAIPPECDNPLTVEVLKTAYYCGAWSLFLRIERVAERGDPMAVYELQCETSAEVEEFKQHMTKGYRP